MLLTVTCESKYSSTPSPYLRSINGFSSKADFENQGAWQIGKAHDPKGVRTIGMPQKYHSHSPRVVINSGLGVLTKPDRIEQGNEESWFSLLRNETEPLQHEWYCAKLPGPEELADRISWADARLNEEQFFGQPPWIFMTDVRPRLSVSSLMEGLSDVLSEVIAKEYVPNDHPSICLCLSRAYCPDYLVSKWR